MLAVSKVRKPEQRETRLKSQIETRPWAPSCCAIPSSLPRAGLVHRAIGAGLGRAGPHWHDLVLALAHLYVSNSSTGCLRPSVRPEGSFGNLTKRV